MGATNTTANYNLSQFISTDKPAWLQDYNGDMLKIDTGINAAKLAADTAQSTATNAQSDASSAVNSVSTLATTVSSLSTAIGGINGTLNTITSLIGNGTPTTTDHTIIGAINELHADQGNLANLQTTDKSSLVAAINEAAQSGGGGGGSSEISEKNSHLFTSIAAESTATESITFNETYVNTPIVLVGVTTVSADSPTGGAFVTAVANQCTNTGFDLTVRNSRSQAASNIRASYVVISMD